MWLNRDPMFHPLSLFVGLRYVRARTHKFFVSFITWASVLGVCVGVAALIVIMSVMNGFEDELRDRLLSLTSHARVVARDDARPPSEQQWQQAEATIRGTQHVAGVAPYVEVQALAERAPEMLPVLVRGIDTQAELSVTDIGTSITQGRLADLVPGEDRVLAGPVAAERLALGVGDSLSLLIPTVAADGTLTPKLREVTVAGTFDASQPDNESGVLFAPIDDVKALAPEGDHGLRVRFDNALAAPQLATALRRRLPQQFQVIDWTEDNASYFRAIRIEKTMMAIILMLIVAVAAFNLVSMLVMVVTDKRTDIAILRTFGTSPRGILGVFITQGLVIGWLGVALGVALGLAIALNVDTIVPFLEHTFGFHILDAEVFADPSIPSDVKWTNIAAIGVIALVLTGVAAIYPSIRAARTAPAEALRYE
jgi:lipoprotein-releasing system permease protein